MKNKQTPMHAAGAKCKTVPGLPALVRALFGPAIANSTTQPAAEPGEIGLANALDLDAGGNPVIPYGTHQHKDGIQVFNREHAEAMAKRFSGVLGKVRRLGAGIPVYVGHPDHPAFANKHTDGRAYGWITGLEARDDGLVLLTDWTDDGKALVNSHSYRFTSPHWLSKPTGRTQDGKPIVHPTWLVSLGLTNTPNIDMAPLGVANQSDQQNQPQPENPEMNEYLKQLLGLPDDATDEQIMEALKAAVEAMNGKGEEEEEAQAELAQANAQLQETLNAERDQRKTAELALANAQQAHANALLDVALAEGRITPAQRSAWSARFSKNHAEAEAALANEDPGTGMHTKSITGNLGKASGTARGKQDQILSLCNEAVAEKGITFDQAYKALKKEQPALFETTAG